MDVAAQAGITKEDCGKGVAWGDYDNDGWLDLFVSNMAGACALYQNQHNGTFVDVAQSLHVTGPSPAFACWFWDYDNDGGLDLYVNDFRTSLADYAALALGRPFPIPAVRDSTATLAVGLSIRQSKRRARPGIQLDGLQLR